MWWEAEQLTVTLGAPVVPMLCLHDTQLPWDELYTEGIPVLPPSRLVATPRALPPHMDEVGIMLLAEHAGRRRPRTEWTQGPDRDGTTGPGQAVVPSGEQGSIVK